MIGLKFKPLLVLLNIVISASLQGCNPTFKPIDKSYGISLGDTLRWKADPSDNPAELINELRDIRSIGLTWIRIDFDWSVVQTENLNVFDWVSLDKVIQEAINADLQVLPILTYTPTWASEKGCKTPKCEPRADKIGSFAHFCGEAARRYAPLGIHHWEIWNEPNNHLFWHPRANPARYAQLVNAATISIKRQDPNAKIIVGSMAPAASNGLDSSPVDFLATIIPSLRDPLELLSFHPYSYPNLASDRKRANSWNQLERSSNNLTEILNQNKLFDTGLWITEYGAPTGGPGKGWNGKNDTPTYVSEPRQASMLVDSIREFQRSSRTKVFFWYTYSDFPNFPNSLENNFGLIRLDGSKKPAYFAYKDAIANSTN